MVKKISDIRSNLSLNKMSEILVNMCVYCHLHILQFLAQ